MTTTRSLQRLVAAIVLIASAVGCSDSALPSAGEWRPSWAEAVATVPSQEALGEDPSEEVCQDVLGELREARADLPPAPDEVVADAVDAWFAYAEHVFFTCFEDIDSDQPVETAYDALARLEAEVGTTLETADQQ